MKKTILLAFLILFVGVCFSYGLEDKVVAIVNNEVITKAELDTYISILKMQMKEEGWREYGMTEKKALESLIENRLIVQEAKGRKIESQDRDVESRLERIRNNFPSAAEFSDFLSKHGLSLSELKEHMKEQLLTERLIAAEIRSRILISPGEVTDYYQKHSADFYTPERADVESIFVGSESLAKDVYGDLKAGADFEQLQKDYSKRASIGIIARGDLRKDIEEAIFGLEIGKFSKPFETPEGYYIFLVKEQLSPSEKKLSEVQPEIYNIVWENKFNSKLQEFIERLKAKAYIRIKDEK